MRATPSSTDASQQSGIFKAEWTSVGATALLVVRPTFGAIRSPLRSLLTSKFGTFRLLGLEFAAEGIKGEDDGIITGHWATVAAHQRCLAGVGLSHSLGSSCCAGPGSPLRELKNGTVLDA